MLSIEQIAMACHEVNKSYCESIGDNSQPSWRDAPKWQKDSSIDGVIQIITYPETTPERSHESWLAGKIDSGWKYGPIKDEEKKEHPCMVPFDELPTEQKAKDYIFTAIVKSYI